jgi:hypothetical protein
MKTRLLMWAALALPVAAAEGILIEAEQFADPGGWGIDTQFIESMGSPYLIAHGLGQPVADATTTVAVPAAGTFTVWARTMDWSLSLGRAGGAGRFAISIGGQRVGGELGAGRPDWHWQKAGTVELPAGPALVALTDLTGFNARVDALFLASGEGQPPAGTTLEERAAWRMPGSSGAVADAGEFDLAVIGGGYGGSAASIAAARMGLKVALIQNREVLGGNGSSEIRVWAKGDLPPSEYRSPTSSANPGRGQGLARPRRGIRR